MLTGNRLPAFVVVTALLIGGCATPAPIVRLNPDAADVIWVAGRASVQKAETGVRVASAFEHQDGRMLALRVEIENGTTERLEIDPRDVTYSVCRTAAVSSCTPSQRVFDPEQMLMSLDVQQSRDTADAINSQAFLGTLVMLSAVGDVTAVASGHADSNTGAATALAASAMNDHAAAVDSAQASIATQREIWSNHALRRNSLFPGQGTSGLVYVPINLQAGFVWLQITTGGRTFPFHFAQAVTQLQPIQASYSRTNRK